MRLILSLLLCLPMTLMAAQVEDLYRGEVPVASRSNADQQAAIRDALAQVLVRVTGDATVATRPEAQSLLRQAKNVLLSYGYQSGTPLRLEVSFDGQRINQQLQAAQLPIWGAQRPQTLIWLAMDDPQDGRLLLSDTTTQTKALEQDAARRGLPLMLPLLDLEDTMAVSINDVWGNFVGPIATASTRYSPDFFLSGRVTQQGDNWGYHMSLYAPKRESEYGLHRALVRREGQAGTQQEAISAMMADLAAYYASRYAAVAGEGGGETQLIFEIDGDIKQLVALERYLRSLAPVQDLTIHSVMGRTITFEVELIGGMNELDQLLSLESRVQLVGADDGFEQDLSDQPRYRWEDR
ncbi:DUF2066 domain-containing protein [Ferrimonas balearica]|uniref:DUF2066 domain-containing protein n=1 Tax=Ferrimonas balearica TaxID=44012 RepID=UPI001C9984CF|nr:DUF2066 domain-containing protein [Ferrimonas balearica]MBY5921080.1 DUF2066 domain-containing protein [Ferrimonas balearica]MBY5996235.1 DUF2066 domain-containing protein [Ferrimonas balearica]